MMSRFLFDFSYFYAFFLKYPTSRYDNLRIHGSARHVTGDLHPGLACLTNGILCQG